MPDARVQQPAATERRRRLHGRAGARLQLHGPRWLDRLVGLVSLRTELRHGDEDTAQDLHESGAPAWRAHLHGQRSRRDTVHRSAALSQPRESWTRAAT